MNRFVRNEDGTVTDNKLGLIWSPTLMDGKDCPYDEAKAAIEALGPEWRFPTTEELFSLVDRTRHDPAIDIDRFPDTKSEWYWTDEETSWDSAAVWVVDFYYGYAGSSSRSYCACVRAVRSVPASQ